MLELAPEATVLDLEDEDGEFSGDVGVRIGGVPVAEAVADLRLTRPELFFTDAAAVSTDEYGRLRRLGGLRYPAGTEPQGQGSSGSYIAARRARE